MLLQLALRRTLGQSVLHGASKLGDYSCRYFERSMRTPFAPNAGRDTLCRHVLRNPANGVDVQPEHTGHFHSRRELGIYQLGHHQPPRSSIVIAPLEQRHRSQKDSVTAALRIFEQPQPATKEDARCRYVVQPWLLI